MGAGMGRVDGYGEGCVWYHRGQGNHEDFARVLDKLMEVAVYVREL